MQTSSRQQSADLRLVMTLLPLLQNIITLLGRAAKTLFSLLRASNWEALPGKLWPRCLASPLFPSSCGGCIVAPKRAPDPPQGGQSPVWARWWLAWVSTGLFTHYRPHRQDTVKTACARHVCLNHMQATTGQLLSTAGGDGSEWYNAQKITENYDILILSRQSEHCCLHVPQQKHVMEMVSQQRAPAWLRWQSRGESGML